MENMVNRFQSTFKNKRVFLTGHTGFKGSWLHAWLILLGAEVKGYSLAPENKNDLYYLLENDRTSNSVIADIRDLDYLKKEIISFQPDFVFHLAAQPLVRLSYHIPLQTFEVNSIACGYLLEAIRYLDKQCNVVMVTTDKVYHNIEQNYAYKEDDKLGGYDPYSASKAGAEIIIDSYRNSFFNVNKYNEHKKSIAVGRAGNVIGGGDWAKDRIIPDIARALSANKPIIVRNPHSVRPWQHVLEPLSGYLQLACCQAENPTKFSQAFNFGPNLIDNLNVAELVYIAIETWGEGSFEYKIDHNALHEANLLQLDISKAKELLNWMPKWNAANAIKETIKWYLAFQQTDIDIKEYTINTIKSYSA